MSLTATLLLGLPVRLPQGRTRLISSDKSGKSLSPRNDITRLANVEMVFNAIADGYTSIFAIEDATSLSQVTVKKALHELEDWPGGPRIVRITAGKQQRHLFHVVTP